MMWFKSHLNLTLLFTLIISNVIGYMGVRASTSYGNLDVVLVILAVVLLLGVEVWHLHQKECSMFYLFWNLIPYVGVIIILGLDNNKQKRLQPKPDTSAPPPTT
jgi:amino acid transporter